MGKLDIGGNWRRDHDCSRGNYTVVDASPHLWHWTALFVPMSDQPCLHS